MGGFGVDLRVCFVGDSIVHGTVDPLGLGWPGRLSLSAARIGRPFTSYNLGVRGDTSEDVRRRWAAEVAYRLIDGIRGAVVFGFGLNDSLADPSGSWRVHPDRLSDNTRDILSRAAGQWPVLVVGPAPVDDSRLPPGLPSRVGPIWSTSNARIAEASARMSAVALELGIPFLALFAELVDLPEWLTTMAESDAVHPSSGYSLISDQFERWPAWLSLLDG